MDDRLPTCWVKFHMSDVIYTEVGNDDAFRTLHVFPDGYYGHIATRICPCDPILDCEDPKTGSETWEHRMIH